MALLATDPRCTAGRTERAEKPPSMQAHDAEFNTQGLPKAFLHSLRTLFDILDDRKRGFVHISEIESRWQGAEAQDLPGGVLQSLRRVAPPHGCLTFERFLTGLRSSILNPDKAQPPNPHGFKVRPLGPSNGTNNNNNNKLPSRTRHHYNNRSRAGGFPTSGTKPCPGDVLSASYGNPSAHACTRSGRSLERVHVAPERALNRSDSVRVANPARRPARVQSVESIPVESYPKTSKSHVFACTPSLSD